MQYTQQDYVSRKPIPLARKKERKLDLFIKLSFKQNAAKLNSATLATTL